MFAPLGFVPGITPAQVAAAARRGGWDAAGVPTLDHYMKLGSWFAGTPQQLIEHLKKLEERYPGMQHINLSAPAWARPRPSCSSSSSASPRRSCPRSADAVIPASGLRPRAGPSPAALQILRLEMLAIPRRIGARQHEHAVAAVVQRARILGRGRHVRLHHLQHEQAVLGDQARIDQPALEAREALADQRRRDLRRPAPPSARTPRTCRCRGPSVLPMPTTFGAQIDGRHVDHARLAPAHHLEAVVLGSRCSSRSARARTPSPCASPWS